ncbi:PREDICTED: uncharacterized protein C12orf29 homolog isoform X2 [Thamnophis sirtalis]|uniref:RNA ligase 1 n=1 Tax=Thamnophis sirtalis TaxID=35019 RepID=A0A6I9Z2B1_9SAUR|nr:PREDICTED: uncharacterized protein C12orf29 homolog isoform X2 [Thamnophis sirtalis]XP_032076491.1 uncharacterized protein C12orf29 homolog isoform X2 [Thamnophis elegans]
MSRLGSVQQKVPCLFVTQVKEEPSAKRERQTFKVLATNSINKKALAADIYSAIPTEKVDGTCCYITAYKGFTWNIEDDFRSVPECWIPAKEIEYYNGKPFPDENGHIPGWVPVEKNSKLYCWHSSAVDYEYELGLILKHHAEEPDLLEICSVPLSEFTEQTLELIGTNINANPYGLGNKKHPIHLLVPHGTFKIKNAPSINHNDILAWLDGCKEGKIEGIVWHCPDGNLIKLHRHHLGLSWPIADPSLASKPVTVTFSRAKYNFEPKTLFHYFSKLDGQRFSSLRDIISDL